MKNKISFLGRMYRNALEDSLDAILESDTFNLIQHEEVFDEESAKEYSPDYIKVIKKPFQNMKNLCSKIRSYLK